MPQGTQGRGGESERWRAWVATLRQGRASDPRAYDDACVHLVQAIEQLALRSFRSFLRPLGEDRLRDEVMQAIWGQHADERSSRSSRRELVGRQVGLIVLFERRPEAIEHPRAYAYRAVLNRLRDACRPKPPAPPPEPAQAPPPPPPPQDPLDVPRRVAATLDDAARLGAVAVRLARSGLLSAGHPLSSLSVRSLTNRVSRWDRLFGFLRRDIGLGRDRLRWRYVPGDRPDMAIDDRRCRGWQAYFHKQNDHCGFYDPEEVPAAKDAAGSRSVVRATYDQDVTRFRGEARAAAQCVGVAPPGAHPGEEARHE